MRAISASDSLSKYRSTKKVCCSGVSGRRNARATRRRAKSRSFFLGSVVPGASVARRDPMNPATSRAASVVASSHPFETEALRSYPMLRSSGGKAVATTRTSGNLPGER